MISHSNTWQYEFGCYSFRHKLKQTKIQDIHQLSELLFLKKCLFIFERDRESAHKQGRGREGGNQRKGRTDPERGYEAGSMLTAENVCGARTHKSGDHDMSWSQMLNGLSYPGVPVKLISESLMSLTFYILILLRNKNFTVDHEKIDPNVHEKDI